MVSQPLTCLTKETVPVHLLQVENGWAMLLEVIEDGAESGHFVVIESGSVTPLFVLEDTNSITTLQALLTSSCVDFASEQCANCCRMVCSDRCAVTFAAEDMIEKVHADHARWMPELRSVCEVHVSVTTSNRGLSLKESAIKRVDPIRFMLPLRCTHAGSEGGAAKGDSQQH